MLEESYRPHSSFTRDAGDGSATASGALQFALPLASTIDRDQVVKALRSSPIEVRIIERDTNNTLGHSLAAVVASGTATVEAAFLGVPMVIIYKGSEINWRLIRPLIHLDTFGMVNLIAGRRIVPELIQHDATGRQIAQMMGEIISSPDRMAEMKRELAAVSAALARGGAGASERAAQAVMNVCRDG